MGHSLPRLAGGGTRIAADTKRDIEHDKAKLDRLAMRMVPQAVREVAENEEPEGVGSVIEIAWPGHEPEQPDGDDDDRRQPGVEGELEALKFRLSNARL